MKKQLRTKHLSHVAINVSNTGRSMVEMLGTLAIIGVLSLVALTAYKIALNSHKANVLLEDVRLYAATILHNEYNIDNNRCFDMRAVITWLSVE